MGLPCLNEGEEKMKRVKPITVKYEDGREYTLEFSRATVYFAEQRGFDINSVGTKLMTGLTDLFWYSFRMHHPKVTKQESDRILFEDLKGLSEDAIDRLIALYNAPFETLVSDEDDDEKNAKAKMDL